ncbi:DoxX family protein [Pedobacter sp. SYP-B3415]|uniref:DoxX family protein n=1 Tax=Pedobacter sp. SYP-B3415 TaxID=2496641 RepID=UPI00101DF71B|nr:DoxX family protein [Pedobacter sp. SYP-B3415]
MGVTFIEWLERNQTSGLFILRAFAGLRLIYGVADNLFSWKHMLLFRDFLDSAGFPVPLLAAILSVYAQASAGICYITGWQIRNAAVLMLFNFAAALLLVHAGQSIEEQTPALAMFFISLLFLFTGKRLGRSPV